jgi:hypothetical protein
MLLFRAVPNYQRSTVVYKGQASSVAALNAFRRMGQALKIEVFENSIFKA